MVTRREFLRSMGFATAAVATVSPLKVLAGIPDPGRPLRIVIVDAGLAGLCAGFELDSVGTTL